MLPKIYNPEKQEAKRLTGGFFILQNWNGRWWNDGEWIDNWELADRFYGPLPPDEGARQLVKDLKAKGIPALLCYIPGSPN